MHWNVYSRQRKKRSKKGLGISAFGKHYKIAIIDHVQMTKL